VIEAHARLPAEPRAVLSLFAVEGLPPAEVAAVLGIPEEATWVRLRDARRVLAAALAR
jgi:DNA-directed RNA polymerase specialized sigma24 family protein